MSLPPQQRFFSLSGTNQASATTAPAPAAPTFVDQSSLDLLVRAAQNNSGSGVHSTMNGTPTGAPGDSPADGGNLQQAFLQSMAQQQQQQQQGQPQAQQAHPSAIFGAAKPDGTQGLNLQANTNPGQNQFGQLFSTMAQPPASNPAPAPAQWATQGAQQAGNNQMISQLVASLQAQQQAQQQAQVQAALARAFGPGANTNVGAAGMGNLGGLNQLQGLAQGGLQLNQNAAQGNQAKDLISKLQAQQQQQQQTPQPSSTPTALGQAAAQATSATALAASNATADDLLKLQMEQERHNRMLQMVQADRQERAMLANQKMKREMKKDGSQGVASLNAAAPAAPVANMLNPALAAQLSANPLLAAQLGAAASLNPALGHNGLINGLNFNVALGAGVADAAAATQSADQHLHQKLGSARGAAIVPCRARGMPVDHNFKTAYFVIPDGIEHGDELMCSYPACRQAGVKFRYCLHCKVPVAKRNFRNRHRHGVPGGDGASSGGEEVEDSEEEEEEETTEAGPKCDEGCEPGCGHDAEDYTGVKKEHVLIIPGAEPAAAAGANSLPLKKKKKKTTRVPCRARGMPMAHNFKTAYFHIPSNIQHGDELLCSFPSCRSAGAKFRYCLHCKVPVAKRNFRNRHKHGNIGGLDKKKGKSEEKPKAEEEPSEKMPALPEAKVDGAATKPEPVEDSKPASTASSEVADEEGKVSISSTQDAAKVQKWVELLENKPNPGDKQAMAAWMMNLMNATDGQDAAAMAAAVTGGATKKEEAKAEDKADEESPVEAPTKEVAEVETPAAVAASEESPIDTAAAAVAAHASEESKKRTPEGEAEEDASSKASEASVPPKKKFKQQVEVEEV